MEIKISDDLKMYGRIAQEFEDSVRQYNVERLNITEAGSHYEFHLIKLAEFGNKIKDWRMPYYRELIGVLKMRILEKWGELDQEYLKLGGRVA